MPALRSKLVALGTAAVASLMLLQRSETKANAQQQQQQQQQQQHKVVIIGGGVMGASTAWSLTGRTGSNNTHVTLIDANHPIRGSWHESRIIRAAYEDKM